MPNSALPPVQKPDPGDRQRDILRHWLRDALCHGPGPLPDVDPTDLEAVVGQLAVFPLLGELTDDRVPPSLRSWVADVHQHYLVRNTLLLHDLADAVAVLQRAGIPALPVKGAALLALDARHPAWRHTEDIDLLVPPERARAADQALAEEGFVHAVVESPILPDGRAAADAVVADHHSEYPRRARRGTVIDLHRRSPSLSLPWEVLWPASQAIPVADQLVHVPAPHHQWQMLSEHVAVHHRLQPAMMARHARDLQRLRPLVAGRDLNDRWSKASVQWRRALDGQFGEPLRASAVHLAVPSPCAAAAWTTGNAVAEQLHRVRRDLRHRPEMLWYKLWPSDAWMDLHWGPAATPLDRALQRGRRLLGRRSPRSEGGSR